MTDRLVGWLVLSSTYSTNRLNHATVISNMSLMGRRQTDNNKNNAYNTFFNLTFVEIISSTR